MSGPQPGATARGKGTGRFRRPPPPCAVEPGVAPGGMGNRAVDIIRAGSSAGPGGKMPPYTAGRILAAAGWRPGSTKRHRIQDFRGLASEIVLRPAFPSPGSPCPISNQSLPSCDSDPEVPAPSALALAHSIPPAPHRSPSVAPPDTHRRFSFNLRCVSGGATEGIGRGWQAQTNSLKTQ